MRLTVEFEPASGSALLTGDFPRHLQASIYTALDPELAEQVHNTGFPADNRALRMMVFSDVKIQGRPLREAGGLRFQGPASVVVASPVREIIASYATSLMKSGEFRVGSERFRVIGVKADDPRVEGGQIEVRSLSPVVAYSTMLRLDGRKYTCYFQPGESDFERLVAENLARKYTAVYGRASGPPVQIDVRRCGRLVVRNYKGTVVKGWHCVLGLRGANDVLKLALDAGLGSKNAQGWGCVEAVG